MKQPCLRMIAAVMLFVIFISCVSCQGTPQKTTAAETTSAQSVLLLPQTTGKTTATEVQTTLPAATPVITTEVPTTEVPTTEVPTTEVPTTEVPTTEVPTTEVPTTEVLTTPSASETITTVPVTTLPPEQTTLPPDLEPILPPEIKNVVLIIGDGMGLEHIIAAETVFGRDYAFTDWQFANVKTNSVNGEMNAIVTTDSAASATALATGVLTQNGYVGKNAQGRDLVTVLDIAKQYNKSTGIVTTDYLYGATPAGFSAHSLSRENTGEILRTQAQSGVDFLCGSADPTTYSSYFGNYIAEGYTVIDDHTQMRHCNDYDKVVCSLMIEGFHSDARVSLRNATLFALNFLDRDTDGFVLVVEQAHIDKNSHDNNLPEMVKCVRSLANTVDAVVDWIGDREDTAILITADHETGGLSVSKEPTLSQYYSTLTGKVYYAWTSSGHTNSNVGLFVYGEAIAFEDYSYYGSEYMVKNTDIIHIMKRWILPDREE